MLNGRPASETSTLPCLRMSSIRSANRPVTCAGSEGAAMVTTALGNRDLPGGCENGRAPPRLWPIKIARALAGFAQMVGGPHQIGDVLRRTSSWRNRPSLEAEDR